MAINQLSIRGIVSGSGGAKRRSAGDGFIRFAEREDTTETLGLTRSSAVDEDSPPETTTSIYGTTVSNLVVYQESYISSLTACHRLGAHVYLHTPKPFSDIFEHKLDDDLKHYVATLAPDIPIVVSKKPNNNDNSDRAEMSLSTIQQQQTTTEKKKKTKTIVKPQPKKITKPKKTKKQPVVVVAQQRSLTTTTPPKPQPQRKRIILDNDTVDTIRSLASVLLKLSKIINRKNSKFFEQKDKEK